MWSKKLKNSCPVHCDCWLTSLFPGIGWCVAGVGVAVGVGAPGYSTSAPKGKQVANECSHLGRSCSMWRSPWHLHMDIPNLVLCFLTQKSCDLASFPLFFQFRPYHCHPIWDYFGGWFCKLNWGSEMSFQMELIHVFECIFVCIYMHLPAELQNW